MENLTYFDYHKLSSDIRDIDPANDCLLYLANRFELNIEQRYWLAFLYSTCYCGATAFYMYNEFPDFETVDVGRLQRWWKANKNKCVFQTDRLRIKSNDQFVPTFESYRSLVGNQTQKRMFDHYRTGHAQVNYHNAYWLLGKVNNVGRFTLFIYLEMIDLLTNFKCQPDRIDWVNADNCRKGLCYAIGDDEFLSSSLLLDSRLNEYQKKFLKIGAQASIYNIETTLCAYAKYKKGQRYVGYYIDRQKKELETMRENVPTGVCWRVIDEFRKETYYPHPNLQLPI